MFKREAFENKKFFITGASSGIGRELAIFLSKLGAFVCISGRDKNRLKKTFEMLSGKEHKWYSSDLSTSGNVSELMKNVYSDFGQLDGLIHCAGVQHTLPIQMISEDTFDKIFRINTLSAFLLSKEFRKKGRYNPDGSSIVFLSSAAAISGESGISEYSASKLALVGISRSLASELSRQKIRVNCIAPGVVKTEMTNKFLNSLTPEQFSQIEGRHLLGLGEVNDVLGSIAFLLSDSAKWITGINLSVDGGYTLR